MGANFGIGVDESIMCCARRLMLGFVVLNSGVFECASEEMGLFCRMAGDNIDTLIL